VPLTFIVPMFSEFCMICDKLHYFCAVFVRMMIVVHLLLHMQPVSLWHQRSDVRGRKLATSR